MIEEEVAQNDGVPRSMPPLGNYLWLFPAGLCLHDLEELLALPRWVASHGPLLDHMALIGRAGEKAAASLRAPFAEQALAVGIVLLAAALVTKITLVRNRRDMWFTAYLVFLGMATLHVLVHLAQSIVAKGYVPGLAGALIVLLPLCLAVYHRLIREKVVTLPEAVFAAITGIGLFIPVMIFVRILASVLAG